MSLATESNDPSQLEPRDELIELTRALRVHAESLMQSGACGVPRAEVPATGRQAESPGPIESTAPSALAPRNPAVMEASGSSPGTRPSPGLQGIPTRDSQRIGSPTSQPRVMAPALPSASAALSTTQQLPSSDSPRVAMAAQPAASLPRVAPPVLPLAERQRQLAVLADSVVGCTRCRLHEQRTQTVFARGNGTSGLCFVGEGPGADEDAQGFPFVGAAGQLLDRMIAAMGFDRDAVYVCNIVKCRPPENRKPQPDEMRTCMPFLREQLELLAPEVIVALGATAVEGLLGIGGGITRLRGTWRLYQGRIAVMPTFHPAYLLRAPSAKHAVWEDMQAVLRHLGRPVPVRGKKP